MVGHVERVGVGYERVSLACARSVRTVSEKSSNDGFGMTLPYPYGNN